MVLGSGGLLGARLISNFATGRYLVHGSHEVETNLRKVDVTDCDSLYHFLNLINPNIIINLVALTNIEKCEEQPELAYQINVKSVENIVRWVQQKNPLCRLIHISSDHVYDGEGLKKENQINLVNYYAYTKFLSEKIALNIDTTIFRTNFFGRSITNRRESFTDWIFNALQKKLILNVYDDIYFNPVSIKTLISIINDACAKRYYGIYNVGSHDGLSKADFVEKFTKIIGIETKLLKRVSYTSNNYQELKRPKNMMMDVEKYEKISLLRMNTLVDEINIACDEYKNE